MAVDLLETTGMNQAQALAALEEATPRRSTVGGPAAGFDDLAPAAQEGAPRRAAEKPLARTGAYSPKCLEGRGSQKYERY